MKERGHMATTNGNRTFPPSSSSSPHRHPSPQSPQHDHRHNRKPLGGGGGGEDSWLTLPARGADINLLANSLSTRLRKAARHRTSPSTPGTTITTTTTTSASSGTRSAPPEESVRKCSRSSSKDSQAPQSILKRSGSKDQQYHHLMDSGSPNPREGGNFHLPDVFMTRRWSSSAGYLNHPGVDLDEVFNNQLLDRPSPALAILGGGGGGGVSSHAHNGHVAWVKRAGIFQPMDKYASGRQDLHGEDQLFAKSQPVDYETVTISSRAGSDTPDSYVSSGWSSGKGSRRKGLKVSWKHPGDSEGDDVSRCTDTATSRRQKSASTVQSEPGTYSFVKPKFHAGRSRVPGVGVKWKVPTPIAGKPPPSTTTDTENETRTLENNSGHSPPSSTTAPSHCQPPPPQQPQPTQRVVSSPGRPSPAQDPRHPWRALHPQRDVHPVTTAMDREGTSVTRTKWKVPSLRPVPAFTFIEDLLESAGRHWHPPGMPQPRLVTRATLDGQSMQNRLKENDVGSLSSKDPAAAASVSNLSNATDQDLEPSNHS